MSGRFVRAESFGNECKITTERRFLWFKPRTVTYVGDSTVWHQYPNGGRPATATEMWLCGCWKRWKWQQQEQAS